MKYPEIIQIIPAQDWFAVYLLPDEPYYLLKPIVCWALQRDEDGVTYVVAQDACTFVEQAGDAENFFIFAHASEINKEEFVKEGKKYSSKQVLERLKGKRDD